VNRAGSYQGIEWEIAFTGWLNVSGADRQARPSGSRCSFMSNPVARTYTAESFAGLVGGVYSFVFVMMVSSGYAMGGRRRYTTRMRMAMCRAPGRKDRLRSNGKVTPMRPAMPDRGRFLRGLPLVRINIR